MKAIISLPFDQVNFLTSQFLLNCKNFTKVFEFVEKENAFQFPNREVIYKYSNVDYATKYSSTKSLPFYFYSNNSYEFKSMMDIVNRWARTYGISNNYLNIDTVSKKILEYWYDFVISNNLDYLILGNVPHTPHDFALYTIFNWLSKKIIIVYPIFNFERDGITYVFTKDVSMDSLFRSPQQEYNSSTLRNDINNFLLRLTNTELDLKYPIYSDYKNESRIIYLFQSIARLFKYRKLSVLWFKLLYIIRFIRSLISKSIFKFHIKKLSEKTSLNDKDYFFFPLHYQPEATTIPTGGIFRDQLIIIRLVSQYLPKNHYLVVKEHPAFFPRITSVTRLSEPMTDYRSREFYNEISRINNVILTDTFSESIDLMVKSKGVVTVSGSICLEALKFSVPVIIFGDHYYKHLPNVTFASSEKAVKYFLNKGNNIENDYYDIYRFFSVIESNSSFIITNPLNPVLTEENATISGYFNKLANLL